MRDRVGWSVETPFVPEYFVDIDAGSDLGKLKAVRGKLEHTAFGIVEAKNQALQPRIACGRNSWCFFGKRHVGSIYNCRVSSL
jgi:hypothetical protein